MIQRSYPIFMDFEASSLDLVASYPVEVGICMADGSAQGWLLRPHVLWLDWSEEAQSVHGISRQRLMEEGHEIRSVAQALNQKLGTEKVYCDAWTFDSFWLHRLYKGARLKPTFELDSISAILTPEQIDRWADTRREVLEDIELTAHRAEHDAMILRETWCRVVGPC